MLSEIDRRSSSQGSVLYDWFVKSGAVARERPFSMMTKSVAKEESPATALRGEALKSVQGERAGYVRPSITLLWLSPRGWRSHPSAAATDNHRARVLSP